MNFALGNSYSLVKKENSPSEFQKIFETHGFDEQKTYAFVQGEGQNFYGLFVDQENYIMTESGKTFANLTFH